MNEQAASLAALNHALLRAIGAGPHDSRQALADAAGVVVNNLNRKLDSLAEAGLIAKLGEAAHQVALTDDGETALDAMRVFAGEAALANADPGGGGGLDNPVVEIPFDLIDPWDGNPRTQFDPAAIEDMAQSIADHGVLQPISVRRTAGGRYEVIIGERRRRGAALAVSRGWIAPGFAVPCQVRGWDEDEALDVAGVENLQRQDLHWMDEARFYLKLAERGRSGAEIARLAGESVSKRKVQDYCKIARELPAAEIARCYLPEGDKDRILYVQARDLVGDKREKPALDLSPKLAATLLETIHAGNPGGALPRLGATILTRLAKAPVGGPFATLQERKLLSFGFHDFGRGREVCAKTPVTEDVIRWLKQAGYHEGAEIALRKARAAVVGDLHAAALRNEGRNFTAELNFPQAQPPAEDLEDEDEDGDGDEDDPPAQEMGAHETAQVRDANAGSATPASPEITPAERRVLREIAARSLHRHRLFGGYVAAQVQALNDPDYQALYALELTTHHRLGDDRLEIALSRRGEDLIKSRGLADALVAKSANSCATPWLREPGVEQAAPADFGEALERMTERARNGEPLDADSLGPAADDDDGTPDYLRRLAGAGPAPRPAPAPASAEPDLPPMLRIVLIEAAHKVWTAGVTHPGGPAAPILVGHHQDARAGQLVQQWRMLAFVPDGYRTLVRVTKAGVDWLWTQGCAISAAGDAVVDDAMLADAQARLGFAPKAGRYSTFWLNEAEPETAPEAAALPAPAGAAPSGAEDGNLPRGGGQADREAASSASASEGLDMGRAWSPADLPPLDPAEIRGALAQLAGAAGQARSLLNTLTHKAKPANRGDVDPTIRLIEAALERAAVFLTEQG